jgi:hypothetical protein
MRPAFSSRRQAIGFLALLLGLLALPGLTAISGVKGGRRDLYSDVPVSVEPFRWVQSQVFSERSDIDLAFVGSSRLMFGINTRYVRARLSEQLGRPATVVTIGWGFSGYDSLYYVVRDLLSRRRARTLVIYDEYNCFPGLPYPDHPSVPAGYLFRWNDAAATLAGLSAYDQLRAYAAATLLAPRQLAKPLHPDAVFTLEGRGGSIVNPLVRAGDLVAQLGSARARLRRSWQPDFIAFASPAPRGDAAVFPGPAGDLFAFHGPPTPSYERHFARLLAELCQARGVRLWMLHPPTYAEFGSSLVPERERPEDIFGRPVPLLGIPGARLFAGVRPADLPQYFVDDVHLNQNGQDLFTSALTPALLKLYAADRADW